MMYKLLIPIAAASALALAACDQPAQQQGQVPEEQQMQQQDMQPQEPATQQQ